MVVCSVVFTDQQMICIPKTNISIEKSICFCDLLIHVEMSPCQAPFCNLDNYYSCYQTPFSHLSKQITLNTYLHAVAMIWFPTRNLDLQIGTEYHQVQTGLVLSLFWLLNPFFFGWELPFIISPIGTLIDLSDFADVESN